MKINLYVLCCCWLLNSVFSINQLLLGVGEPNSPISKIDFGDFRFKQKLDHFNFSDTRTFDQRFDMNDEFYQIGGPAFLFIEGAESKSDRWMHSGAWIEYAREFKAICFQIEHRYYGASCPTDDLSTDNLKYLNSRQAIADLAHFISTAKNSVALRSPSTWIVFGGSYAGSLAAMMRLKYPNLVKAAVSSSSTYLARADFKEYFQRIESILSTYDPFCLNNIKVANVLINDLLKTDIGAERLRKRFKFCTPLDRNNKKQVSNFFSSIAYSLANIVQYSKVNRRYDYPARSIASIETLCDDMNDDSVIDLIDRYATAVKANRRLLSTTYKKNGCIPSYDFLIELYSKSYWTIETENARQWMYQSCTEFGYYQTSYTNSSMFGQFPLDYFTNMCADVFGKSFNLQRLSSGIRNANSIYDRIIPLNDPRTIFVYGSNDPWLPFINGPPNIYSIYIEGTSHCADMYASTPYDIPQLKEARLKIKLHLKHFLEN